MPCECTKEFIRSKISEIEEKVAGLEELKAKLDRLPKLREFKVSAKSICPIIEAEKGT